MLKLFRTWAGILLMGFGGFLGVMCAFLALAALFGGLEIDSLGERMLSFVIYVVLAAVGFGMLYAGRRLKTPRYRSRAAVQSASASQPEGEKPEAAQPSSAKPSEVTVERAWRSFSEEEQKRFDAQVYQYSQDVGRDGNMPREAAAENRGLVFVDGRPVPREVARRLEEMRREAKEKEEEGRRLRQEIDECAAFMSRMEIIALPYTEYDLRTHAICKDKTTGQAWDVWLKVVGHSGVSFASTALEVFEEPPRAISEEELAVRMGWKQAKRKPCAHSGRIGVVRELSMTETKDGAFSFEKKVIRRDVVQMDEKYYLRVTDYECAAGANGRPVYRRTEDYYEADPSVLPLLTAESDLEHVAAKPAVHYTDGGEGALF